MQGSGGISVSSSTVPEGQDVEVQHDGSGKLELSIDGGPWVDVPVDPKTGRAKVTAPVGSKYLVFADQANNKSITVEVVSTADSS